MRKCELVGLVKLKNAGAEPPGGGESNTYDEELEEAIIRPVEIVKDSAHRKYL